MSNSESDTKQTAFLISKEYVSKGNRRAFEAEIGFDYKDGKISNLSFVDKKEKNTYCVSIDDHKDGTELTFVITGTLESKVNNGTEIITSSAKKIVIPEGSLRLNGAFLFRKRGEDHREMFADDEIVCVDTLIKGVSNSFNSYIRMYAYSLAFIESMPNLNPEEIDKQKLVKRRDECVKDVLDRIPIASWAQR